MATDPFQRANQNRDAFAAARARRVALEVRAAEAERELEQMQRIAAAGDEPVLAAVARQAQTKKSLEDAWRDELELGKNPWDIEGDLFIPPDPLAHLAGTKPIVLLPVRIETRFVPERDELRIRVYPDEIASDMHEEALSPGERAAGEAFWRTAWIAADEPAAWTTLAAELGSTRAAFVAAALEPLNRASRPAGEPMFPTVPERPDAMHRSVETWVMPERWLVIGYLLEDGEHREVFRRWSTAVAEPLALTPDPNADSASMTLDGDLTTDTASAWTFDYERAVEEGMAVTIQYGGDAVDRLLVVGVKASFGNLNDRGAEALRRLLDGHHYSSGLSFIAQGTPTNNTTGQPSGYPADDAGGAVSFEVERGAPRATAGTDGAAVAAAFGLPASVFDHVAGAERIEQQHAAAMADALWPVTLGYYLEQMMAPILDDAAVRRVREYARAFVRGRGPLPAIRVGSTPYGLLPVTSLDLYQQHPQSRGIEGEVARKLALLRPYWKNAVPRVARAGTTNDPDAELMAILSLDASSREVRVRTVRGEDTVSNLLELLRLDRNEWFAHQRIVAGTLLAQLQVDPLPRLVGMTFSENAFRFAFPLVAATVAEDVKLPFNYIRWVRLANIPALRNETFPADVEPPVALLYRLLRHAALVEYERLALELHVLLNAQSAFAVEKRVPELIGIVPGTTERATTWQRFDARIPAASQTETVGAILTADTATGPTRPQQQQAIGYRRSLQALEELSTAELQRLFTETLDVNSHRLDAWITSLATHRLAEMRRAELAGTHLGIYGWVEDLRIAPRERRVPVVHDGRQLTMQNGSGGFIHAPSMSHAATAAILRNAHLTRGAADPERYAIDLSSERVRRARWFLDGVRAGQAVGALLGYQFERGLHDRTGADLDRHIDTFRALYPLLANKREASGEDPAMISARNVVDGLALYAAHRDGSLPIGTFGLSSAQRTAVVEELEKLGDSIDCVADLLLAESVHQLVLGSTDAATTSMDAFAAGTVRPPDPGIAQTPRGGTQLTHRLGFVFRPGSSAGAWPTAATPRALAQPELDAWLGTLLGDPADIRCIVTSATVARQEVSLADLGLRPLDVITLAAETSADGISELDRRVAFAAHGTIPDDESIEIRYAGDPAWAGTAVMSFAEAFEIARAAAQVVRSARSMRAEDLLRPEDPMPEAQPARIEDALRARATAAANDLRSIVELLSTARSTRPLPSLLMRLAAYGIPTAFPASRDTWSERAVADLLERVQAGTREANARLQKAQTAASAVEALQALFGADFRVLTPFVPANPSELALARAAGSSLGADAEAVQSWWRQCARVRPHVEHARIADMLCTAAGTAAFDFEALQLPHGVHARWVALPFASEASRPPSGLVSVAVHFAATPDADGDWIGLLLDEWGETIPFSEQATGISFHYDDPGAEAAQAILIAVPPKPVASWDLGTLLAIVHETIDLAKIRAVDLELLGDLGQLLPAVFVSGNLGREAVSTTFFGSLVGEPRIVVRST